MSVESDIYTRLSAYAGIIALVSAKIYPLTLPQDVALPALSYFKVSDVPEHAMGLDADIKTIRIQVDCWADTYSVAKSLEVQVKAALSRYRSGNIKDCFFDNSVDFYIAEENIYHIPLDFIIYYAG